MAADQEREHLLRRDHSSIFSYATLRTPKFGDFDWYVLNVYCLLYITFLSLWQVMGKIAMTLNLESSEEVCRLCIRF